ncbi:peptidylprolyl isomerase fpr3 [Rhizina undulata]
MSGLFPVALWTMQIPAGDEIVPAVSDIPAIFRITMAALDPTAKPREDDQPKRATLKILRHADKFIDDEAEEDSEDEDSEEESEEEEVNPKKGGKLSKKDAALAKLLKAAADADDMEVDSKKKNKKTKKSDDEEDEDENDHEEDYEIEEFVLCTLDTEKNYQQPLDITISEKEEVFFKVSGNFDIYLTGNYVVAGDVHSHDHDHDDYSDDDSEADYDLSPDEDELHYGEDDSEEDELDDIEEPRITEIVTDEEDVAETKKEKKADKKADKKGLKRPAEDEGEDLTLDELIAKSKEIQAAAANGDAEKKLSKKQLKKMKANDGKAVPTTTETPDKKCKDSKKVQFAKKLEQGPTPSPATEKKAGKPAEKSAEKPTEKATEKAAEKPTKRVVQGVTIDDKKIGSGPAAKSGNRLSMRYIGKLQNGKVFDQNTKGKVFSFKLGKGEVIKGWEIGLQGMQIGGERRLTIPAAQAYGKQSLPGIPANSTLIFDVKLLEIK